MYETLMEIMEPRLQVIFKERENAGIQKGMIKGTVDILRDLGYGDEEIKAKIMEKYGLKEEEAGLRYSRP